MRQIKIFYGSLFNHYKLNDIVNAWISDNLIDVKDVKTVFDNSKDYLVITIIYDDLSRL